MSQQKSQGGADRTGCHWPWRSSKIDDFHFIWKGVCHFLHVLVIKSNLGRILHRLATIHPRQTDDKRTDDNHDKGPTLKLAA